MSHILCIETGTDICSVALSLDGTLISLRESGEGRNHAQHLAVFVKEILDENNLCGEDLAAVAVGQGPGSYTGLRIGVSLAKGICYAYSLPLIAVNSLQSLAMVAIEDYEAGILDIKHFDTALLCPMIDARRMEVYAQLFDHHAEALTEVTAEIIHKDSFLPFISRAEEFVIFGSGAAKCVRVIEAKNVTFCDVVPSARGMVNPAHRKWQDKTFEDIAYFEPFYLKDFIAGVPKRNPLVKPAK